MESSDLGGRSGASRRAVVSIIGPDCGGRPAPQTMKDLCNLARRSRRLGLTANRSRSTARAANPITTSAATMPRTMRPARAAAITMATKATKPRMDARHPIPRCPLGAIISGPLSLRRCSCQTIVGLANGCRAAGPVSRMGLPMPRFSASEGITPRWPSSVERPSRRPTRSSSRRGPAAIVSAIGQKVHACSRDMSTGALGHAEILDGYDFA